MEYCKFSLTALALDGTTEMEHNFFKLTVS